MILTNDGLKDRAAWKEKGYRLPRFDRQQMVEKTLAHPTWIHFGAGNIFKAFQADACQRLLDNGYSGYGVVAADYAERSLEVNDNLVIKVTLKTDGSVEKAVIASISEKVYVFGNEDRLQAMFEDPKLQMASFTITEKGYALYGADGEYLPAIKEDLAGDPENPSTYMGRITKFLHDRYVKNGRPVAMVSMDNCSHNGDKLKAIVMAFAQRYGEDFVAWLEKSVSFPWSMIDKITPAPSKDVEAILLADGLPEGTPFVNAEESEYLVIEDDFPNGRPALEKAGIFFTDRETVDKVERMKVCTCLNPLHTALAVYGCLLGFDKIASEMKDEDLVKLVETIGYKEGLPVVVDPGIINPKEFIDTVVNVRIPNPFMPDTPQRIATDTSQKLSIRFGETIKNYIASNELDVANLKLIPLVFAGWLRYLMAINDNGEKFEPSPDPLLETVQPYVAGFNLDEVPEVEKLHDLLANKTIFGVDLYEAGLADAVCAYFKELCAGKGAVRSTLHKYVDR